MRQAVLTGAQAGVHEQPRKWYYVVFQLKNTKIPEKAPLRGHVFLP